MRCRRRASEEKRIEVLCKKYSDGSRRVFKTLRCEDLRGRRLCYRALVSFTARGRLFVPRRGGSDPFVYTQWCFHRDHCAVPMRRFCHGRVSSLEGRSPRSRQDAGAVEFVFCLVVFVVRFGFCLVFGGVVCALF